MPRHILILVPLAWALASLLILRSSEYTPAVTAHPQTASWTAHWWHTRHTERKVLARHLSHVDLLFIGDSLTHGWESESGYPVWRRHFASARSLNLGFAGDRTEHVLWRLRDGALTGFTAHIAVILIGTNNVGHRSDSPPRVAAGIGAVVAEVIEQRPETHVLLLGLLPRGRSAADPLRQRTEAVNARLAAMAWPEPVTYVDVSSVFLEPDGTLPETLAPDGLHLSRAGYEALATALESVITPLRERLKSKSRRPPPRVSISHVDRR